MADCPRCGTPLDPITGKCPACVALGFSSDEEAPLADKPADPIIAMEEGPTAVEPTAKPDEKSAAEQAEPELVEEQAAVGTDERFIQDVRALDHSGAPAVVMMGLSGAGKSWLLHRFLEVISITDYTEPSFVEVTEEDKDGVELGRTTSFDFYRVTSDSSYRLIDTPGEQSKLLTAGDLKLKGRDVVPELWQLSAVLSRASALIVALPCDTAIVGPLVKQTIEIEKLRTLDRRPLTKEISDADINSWISNVRKDYDELKKFAYGLTVAAATLSYVRHHQIDCLKKEDFAQRVSKQKVLDHRERPNEFLPIGGKHGLTCPSYFALTKWDRLLAAMYGDGEGADFPEVLSKRLKGMWELPEIKIMAAVLEYHGMHVDGALDLERPADLLRSVNPLLHHRLLRYFPMGRFDFASAFFGHLGSKKLLADHYDNHPAYGIEEIRQWIKEARAIAAKGEVKFSTYAAAREMHFFLKNVPISGGI